MEKIKEIIVVIAIFCGLGLWGYSHINKRFNKLEYTYIKESEKKQLGMRNDFEDWKVKRAKEREKELLQACGGGALGALRYPDYDLPTMMREMVSAAVDNQCLTAVSVDRFTEVTVKLRYAGKKNKKQMADDVRKILMVNNTYIYEVVIEDQGTAYLLNKEALNQLAKYKEPSNGRLQKLMKKI